MHDYNQETMHIKQAFTAVHYAWIVLTPLCMEIYSMSTTGSADVWFPKCSSSSCTDTCSS